MERSPQNLPAIPEQPAPGQAFEVSDMTPQEREAHIYAHYGENAYVNAARSRYEAAGAATGAHQSGVNQRGLPAASAGNEVVVASNGTSAVGTNNAAHSRYSGSKHNNQSAAGDVTDDEIVWEIDDSGVDAPKAIGNIIDVEFWEDPKDPTATDPYNHGARPSSSTRPSPMPGSSTPSSSSTPASGSASAPQGASNSTATVTPMASPSSARATHSVPPSPNASPNTYSYPEDDAIDALADDLDRAFERWTKLSARRAAGTITVGATKQESVSEAWNDYMTVQNRVTGLTISRYRKYLNDTGIDPAHINAMVETRRVQINRGAAMASAARRTDFRMEKAADRNPLAKKFLGKWASWNTSVSTQDMPANPRPMDYVKAVVNPRNLKAMFSKNNLKKAAVLGGSGAAVAFVAGAFLPVTLATGGGVLLTMAAGRGIARGLAGSRINSAVNSVTVAQMQERRHVAAINQLLASGITSLEGLTGHINRRTNEDVARNRRRQAIAVSISAVVGALSGTAGHIIGEHLHTVIGQGGNRPNQFAKIPETKQQVDVKPVPKTPEAPAFDPVTMKVGRGDGIENIMTDYAREHGVKLDGNEVHKMFLDAKNNEHLVDGKHTGKNFSGTKPMHVGGGVGFSHPGETTVSPAMVEYLDKNLSFKAVEDYADSHNVKVSDTQLHTLIDKAYADGIIKPGEVASKAQMDQFLADLKK